MEAVRINKFLSQVGYCSRRHADALIEEERVLVNGKLPDKGTKITEADEVRVDGKVIHRPTEQKQVYLAFNKPVGIVCTADNKREKNNIIDFINYPQRIFYAGRLDKQSEGLILLTNDGDIVNKMMRARNRHEKEYIVRVHRPITADFVRKMGEGVPILETVTRKCYVEQLDQFTFKIILTEGLNRQIRRMCEHFDYRVRALKRVRIMNIQLDVPVGKWRELTESELQELQNMLQ